jgi:predicted negative regulator of RcsB-dependent stress response
MTEQITHNTEVDTLRRVKGFWDKNSKPIIYIGAAIILLVGGWLIYKYMFKLPKEEQANNAVFAVQKNFSQFSNAQSDSAKTILAQVVLNGDGANTGVLKFISKYDGSAAANLCKYYAGASYLQLKQFDKAIKYLKDFDTDAAQIQSRAYGMIGDAYAEQKKNNDALEYYKKAADVNTKDEFTTAEYLFRAGLFAETIGKKKDAIDMYKKLRDDYPLTDRAANIDSYLARLGELGD